MEDIRQFIVDKTGCQKEEVYPEIDIEHDLGCTGDDFDEMIEEYSLKFNVNMDTYLWYFHMYEEGHTNNIGRLLFKAPYERVTHIPVTPTLLLGSANAGKWLQSYPDHHLPKRRYDLLVNQGFVLLLFLFAVYKCSS